MGCSRGGNDERKNVKVGRKEGASGRSGLRKWIEVSVEARHVFRACHAWSEAGVLL